jgi:UTP--glucose-1-phosphate uridylyltransferase
MPRPRANSIRSVIVPAAGLGTRLLSATKEQPKEMLPIFAKGDHGTLCLKPALQQIFEQLFDDGVRNFYFIVGREKRAIEDHFTPDRELIQRLSNHKTHIQLRQLECFYNRIDAATIVWVNQPAPKGFGDAVLRAETLVNEESFIVNAGDTCVLSRERSLVTRLMETHLTEGADATLSLKAVSNPTQYGVAEVSGKSKGVFSIRAVVEKPERPRSKLAIMPLYAFTHRIFEALKTTRMGMDRELQLTDAIQKLISSGRRVQALELNADDIRLDVGTPETYWQALQATYRHASLRERGYSRRLFKRAREAFSRD